MIELTEQQHQILAHSEESPPHVVDPATKETFVLLPAAVYERLRALIVEFDDEEAVRAMYAHIHDVMKDDWDDPAMAVYDTYPTNRP